MDSPPPGKDPSQVLSVWSLARQSRRLPPSDAERRTAGTRSASIGRARGVDRCLTVKQVAALLGYSEKQIRRLCRQGKIRTVQASRRAQHRIPLSALREFFEKDQSYWALHSEREFERTLFRTCAENRSEDAATRQKR